ncbi:proteasome accessory factor PafA2 family protein [Candidatus Woesearchaeota archaeon]|nr:proteasome accessory factor PafA2 family protein [Candidatus Woesearchaeota archaeon]
MKQRVFGEETEYGCAFISDDGQAHSKVNYDDILIGAQCHLEFARNQARVYKDTGHIEYATPECLSAHDVVAYSKAGEHILNNLAKQFTRHVDDNTNSIVKGRLRFFRHNTATSQEPACGLPSITFGCHENYSFDSHKLHRSSAPLDIRLQAINEASLSTESSKKNTGALYTIYQHILPFLITRFMWSGSGSLVREDEKPVFQLSQRIPYIKMLSRMRTTGDKGLFNWRDEPHARALGRLHVVCGDANMSEYQTYLKYGSTGIVLGMIEDGYLFGHLNFIDGLGVLRALNKTMDFKAQHQLVGGQWLSALDVQKAYLQSAQQWARARQDNELCNTISIWEETLAGLADNDPCLERRLDWVAKKTLLDSRAAKPDTTSGTLEQINLQYHDIDPDKGLYNLLVKNGMMDTLLCEEAIRVAALRPPEGSRALTRNAVLNRLEYWKRRGKVIKITHVSWDAIWYTVDKFGIKAMHNMSLPTPYDTTKKAVDEVDEFVNSVQVYHTGSVIEQVVSRMRPFISPILSFLAQRNR